MPITTRTETDGITTETQSTIHAPIGGDELDTVKVMMRKILDRTGRVSTFAGRVADGEAYLREVRRRARSLPPRYGSRAWYADVILDAIATVRQSLAHGRTEMAASDAVRVGYLMAEAVAKHDWPAVRLGLDVPKQRRKASAAGVRARRKKNAEDARAFGAAVRAYYRDHPDHSYRTAAQNLPAFRGAGAKAIAALAKRIARARSK